MIACTNIHNFEEGENFAFTISIKHTLGYDMKLYDMILFGSDLILFVSIFNFQYLSVILVVVLINFGVKKQVPQVSFKIAVGYLISFHTFGSDITWFNILGS